MKRLQNQAIYAISNALRRVGYSFDGSSDPFVQEMQSTINSLDNRSINFFIEQNPNGAWVAQSTNIDGIMSGSKDPQEIPEMLKDAVFTYFEIPPKYCDDRLLRTNNEPVKVQQSVSVGA
jgi:predicted RNase H-like HicB family nuclease